MKNLKYLAKTAGLRQEMRGGGLYFKGHGHRWRVNNVPEFQMGDLDFDRWANSVAATGPVPKNKADMQATVWAMLNTTAFRVMTDDEFED